MTCLELSTAMKHGFNPIVLVLYNKGYGTERFLQEGPFNDIPNWEYHRLPDLLGGHSRCGPRGLEKAWGRAANRDRFSLLNIHLDKTDISPALERLAQGCRSGFSPG
jgi:indolepyruvate decarboxylase